MRDYLIGSTSEALPELATRERLAAWEETVRTTCETLANSGAGEIAAASVTLSQGMEGAVALLCGLIEELADQYGVDVSFKLGHGSLTARFTTAPAPTGQAYVPTGYQGF